MVRREGARQLWAETGLRVSDLSRTDLATLRSRLDRELIASGLITRCSFRMERRIHIRTYDGRVRTAELRCRSDYFTDRQAVTFEKGGFVGFAGWADEVNVRPGLTAFTAWVTERAARRVPA